MGFKNFHQTKLKFKIKRIPPDILCLFKNHHLTKKLIFKFPRYSEILLSLITDFLFINPNTLNILQCCRDIHNCILNYLFKTFGITRVQLKFTYHLTRCANNVTKCCLIRFPSASTRCNSPTSSLYFTMFQPSYSALNSPVLNAKGKSGCTGISGVSIAQTIKL